MWTDSSTLLSWNEGNGKYQQSLHDRVKEIHHPLPNFAWKHCPTFDNPADLGTREKIITQLQNIENWWHGPA